MPVPIDHGARQEAVDLEPTRMRMAVGEDRWTAQGRNTCVGSVKDQRDDEARLFAPVSGV